eukprot:scaffold10.g2378.t1
MKRGHEPDKQKGNITWDEDNLEENERIKKELNPRKIEEPKTPYLSPMETEDEEEGHADGCMSPLALEEEVGPSSAAAAAAAAAATAAAAAAAATAAAAAAALPAAGPPPCLVAGRLRRVAVPGGGWGPHSQSDSSPHAAADAGAVGASPRAGRSPRFSLDAYYGSGQDEDSDHEADPERQEKRRRFLEARKQHYNVREQLARAKALLEEEEEEEEGEEGAAGDAEDGRRAEVAAAVARAAAEARRRRATHARQLGGGGGGGAEEGPALLNGGIDPGEEA